jgi:hypothetical protein
LFNSETARRAFDERISYLDSYARRLRLPRELRQKVRDYYHVKYKDGRLDNDDEILRDLNPSLREEILLHKAYQFTSKVPLLSRSPEQFKAGIISMLQSTISFPGDVILREGTTGNAVFFIDSGVVEIRSQLVDNRVVTAIADGCYFGEVSALLGCKRTATATAKTVCIMYTCDAKKFVGLLDGFKDLMSHVENVARKRRRRIESFGDGFNPVLMGLQADNDSIYDEDEVRVVVILLLHTYQSGMQVYWLLRWLPFPRHGAAGCRKMQRHGYLQPCHPEGLQNLVGTSSFRSKERQDRWLSSQHLVRIVTSGFETISESRMAQRSRAFTEA